MMEIIISFSPRVIFRIPGIMPHTPPARVPASMAASMPGNPVSPRQWTVQKATVAPKRNCPSPPRLNTPHL